MASNPNSLGSSFAEQFRQIRAEFVLGLAKREIEIRGARNSEELNAALHKLAGAAGGFGFEELSQLACKTMASCCDGDTKHLRKNIASLQHAMRIIRAQINLSSNSTAGTVLPHFR